MEDARKQPSSEEILLWMTPPEFPKALQAPECSELLDPMRARDAGASPNTSQVSLKFIGSRTLQMKNLLAMLLCAKANTQTKSKSS